jgi:hypothetical protein
MDVLVFNGPNVNNQRYLSAGTQLLPAPEITAYSNDE